MKAMKALIAGCVAGAVHVLVPSSVLANLIQTGGFETPELVNDSSLQVGPGCFGIPFIFTGSGNNWSSGVSVGTAAGAQGGVLLVNEPYLRISVGGKVGAWSVGAGGVGLLSSYWQSAEGKQSLGLSGDQNGSIAQTIVLPAAGEYLLTFAISGNPDESFGKTVRVSFGSGMWSDFTFGAQQKSRSDMGWEQRSWQVHLAAGSTDLMFQDISGASGYGVALDNISLTAVSAVPEPATIITGALLLLPLGVSLLRGLGRKRAD